MTDKPSYEEQEQRIKELEKEALEQKLAMEKIKESEERFRLVFEKSNDVMLVHKFGEIKDVNRMACEVTGYSRKQLLAMSVLDLFPEDYQSEIKSRLKKNVQKGATSFETKWKRSDGKLIDVEVSSSAFNPKDETRVGITRDITERKQAEEALKESEERYRMMFEHAGFAITIVNAETGERVAFNKVAHESLGYTYAEYRDLQTSNQNVSETTDEVKEHFRRIIEKGSDVFETQHRTKDGEIRDMLMSAVPILIGGEIFIQSVRIDITDRKQAEKALKDSKEKYKELYDEAPVGYMEYDTEGNITRVNQRELEMLGYTAKEMLGQPVWNFVVEKEEAREIIKAKLSGDKPPSKNLVRTYMRKDGTTFPCLINDAILEDKDGRVIGIRSTIQDITEHKQAEEALRESEEFSASLLEHSPNPILVLNQDSSIKYVNPALEKLTGYSLAEIEGGKAPFPWWIDDPRSGDLNVRGKSILKGGHSDEILFQKKNGESFWVEITTTSVNFDGELKYALTTWVDITERKKVADTLLESENFNVSLLDNSPTSILVVNPDSSIKYVNSALEKLTGYSLAEIEGGKAPYPWWIEGDPRSGNLSKKKETMFEANYNIEKIFRKKNGEEFWVEINTVAVRQNEEPKYALTIWIDITDRKRTEEEKSRLEAQLQQAQKMESIGTLAGGIAHDFNNILSPIMMYSEMAIMDLPADNPIQHNLKGIYSAGERARDLVNQILTYSRKGEVKQIAIKITPIIKDVLKMLRSSIPTTIDIQQNLEAESDTVLADPTQINQIMLNLGSNAAHAMREKGGILEVSLEQEDLDSETTAQYTDLTGSYLKLTVSDNGTGIDNETIQKIFEPYFTTKEVGEGTGMGLSLVHGIVKSYGGDIIVESELGKGTTFEVYLPRIEKEVASVAEPSVQLPKGSERVLFADDENVSVDVMKAMLENLGYQVTARTSSIEALEAFRHNPEGFDLVITDMTMPNMTGKELAKEIMSIRSDLPIILCTGFSEQIDESRAKEMGISAYLMKPIIIRDMANTIREVLDKK